MMTLEIALAITAIAVLVGVLWRRLRKRRTGASVAGVTKSSLRQPPAANELAANAASGYPSAASGHPSAVSGNAISTNNLYSPARSSSSCNGTGSPRQTPAPVYDFRSGRRAAACRPFEQELRSGRKAPSGRLAEYKLVDTDFGQREVIIYYRPIFLPPKEIAAAFHAYMLTRGETRLQVDMVWELANIGFAMATGIVVGPSNTFLDALNKCPGVTKKPNVRLARDELTGERPKATFYIFQSLENQSGTGNENIRLIA
jgi:hypothetical protein